jgi:hypothetical protein
MSDLSLQKGAKADIDQVAVTNRDFMSESERDDSARDREQNLLSRRQLGTVIAAREQVAVHVHGDGDRGVPHALLAPAWAAAPTRRSGRAMSEKVFYN